jgi:hypothetical protein
MRCLFRKLKLEGSRFGWKQSISGTDIICGDR